jgi:molybdate transport system substrate-binding protein
MRRRRRPLLLIAAALPTLLGLAPPWRDPPRAEPRQDAPPPAPVPQPGAAMPPVRVLSAGAVEPGLEAALARFRALAGGGGDQPGVVVAYATAPQIRERLAAGEAPDLLIAPVALVNELAAAGRLAGERAALGRVGIGAAVRADAGFAPEIDDIAGFRRAVEEAERVVFNRATTGLFLERTFEKLGLGAALGPKAVRYATGAEVMRHVRDGTGRELALGPITEILMVPGLRYLGPLPGEAQNVTAYAAAVMPNAAPAAAALLDFLSGPEGREAFRAAGIDPAP